MKKRKRKQNIKLLLVTLLFLITIGYATLQTNLSINGISKINNSTWNVYWDNVVVTTGSVIAEEPEIDAAKTTVTYDITLTKPGDFYEFTIDAVNDGSIDAMIELLSSKIKINNESEQDITSTNLPAYLKYSVTYIDGAELSQKQKLDAGTTETYKVRVEYKRDIEESDLPTTEQNLSFTFNITYIQKDNTATTISRGFTGTKYTINIINLEDLGDIETNENIVKIGRKISSSINLYDSLESVIEDADSLINDDLEVIFFKHIIENDIVKESYLGIKIKDNVPQEYSEMQPGIYYLRGGVDEHLLSSKPIYETNKQTIKTIFSNNNFFEGPIEENYKSVNCSNDRYSSDYIDDGIINATINDPIEGLTKTICGIGNNGISFCANQE